MLAVVWVHVVVQDLAHEDLAHRETEAEGNLVDGVLSTIPVHVNVHDWVQELQPFQRVAGVRKGAEESWTLYGAKAGEYVY